jgi:MFS family permease
VSRFGRKAVCTGGLLTTAVTMLGYRLLGTATPIWVLEVTFFLQGASMGTVIPAATESVMSVVPRDRGGAGSALTNIARQVAVALGVAVLGSVLAQAYRGQLAPLLTALPPGTRDQATASIAATQQAAAHLGAGAGAGRALLAAAPRAFVHAMHITSLISAGIALVGAAVMLRWMPGRAVAPAPVPVPEKPGGPGEPGEPGAGEPEVGEVSTV